MKTKTKQTAAFVLAEVLIALSIVAILIPSTVAMLNLLQHSFEIHQDIQDEVSLNQLRRTLLLAEDVACLNDHITFTYHEKECDLVLCNQKLILKPGTQIYLLDIDDVYFYEANHVLYLQYQRKDETYEAVLTYQP